jgi:hypothetical protein
MATAWRNEMPRGTHASDAWHPPVGCITPLVTDHSPSVGSVVGDWTSTLWCLKKQWCDLRLQRRERGTTWEKRGRLPQASVCGGPTCVGKLQAVASQAQAIWEERKGRGSGGRERASERARLRGAQPGISVRDSRH